MKKFLTSLLCVMMIVCFMPSMAWAEEGETTESPKEITENTTTLETGDYILKADITLKSGALKIESGKKVSINLNGHKLTNSADAHTIENYGTLTIKDLSQGTPGTVDNESHAHGALVNHVGGEVTILAGNFTRSKEAGVSSSNNGGNSWYVIQNQGTMTIGSKESNAENSRITVEANGKFSSLFTNGWQDGNKNTDAKNAELVINGGTYKGGLNTIKNDDYGELTINGGEFSNTAQASILNWNVATINGGSFNSDKYAVLNGYSDGIKDKGELTIKGGDFTSKNITIERMSVGTTSIGTVKIQGGNFTASSGNKTITNNVGQTGSISVESGIFSNTIQFSYVAANKVSEIKADGSTEVKDQIESYVANINNKQFYNFVGGANAAIKAATPRSENGDVVTLKESSNYEKILPKGTSLTVILENSVTCSGIKAAVGCELQTETTELEGNKTQIVYTAIVTPQSAIAMVEGENGPVYYNTLAAAVTNANEGQTVKLLKNYEMTGSLTIKKGITLDLNGKEITSSGSYALYITAKDTTPVTIIDSSKEGTGKIINTKESGSAVYLSDAATVVNINAGTIIGSTAVNANKGTVNISAGTIKGNLKKGTSTSSTHEISVAGGIFSDPDVKNFAGDRTIASLTSGDETLYFVGDATSEISKTAKKGDNVDVLQGDLSLTNVKDGVTVSNSNGGKVSVNNVIVTKDKPVTTYTPIYIPPTPTVQKPVIEPNADVTTSLSSDGTTLTIKANDGYEITDVTVNGVSKGAVDKLTGLKTGDKVVIKTQKVEKPDDNAALIEAVKSFKLVARSANAKAPSGKKAIKVTWFAKDGSELNFDGYEIYRSTKKNSGYGTKPIYKTTKSLQYFNTSAKKGTKYYYKVRGYKMIGGEKVYTQYSLKAIRTAK